jgi:predicted XRE-type DNA-binding protein
MTAIVISGSLHRVQRQHKRCFVTELQAASPEPVRRPARIAFMLALGHQIERMVSARRVRDQAEVARLLGLTRARITQLVNLTRLAPDLQDVVLGLEAIDGLEPMSERELRQLSSIQNWQEQRRAWSGAGFLARIL